MDSQKLELLRNLSAKLAKAQIKNLPDSYWEKEDREVEKIMKKNRVDITMTRETFHRKFDL